MKNMPPCVAQNIVRQQAVNLQATWHTACDTELDNSLQDSMHWVHERFVFEAPIAPRYACSGPR